MTPDGRDSPDRVDDGTRTHLRGSGVLLAGRMVAMGLSMAIQVVLVRNLSRGDFGAFSYGLSIASSLVFIVGLGQSQALNRFLAIYEERGQPGRFRGAVLLATVTVTAAGAVVIGLAWIFRSNLEGAVIDDPTAVTVLLILLFLTPLRALDRIAVAVLAVMARARAIAFRKHLLTPILQLLAVATLVAVGAGVQRIAQAYVVVAIIGIGAYLVLIVRTLRRTGRWKWFWSGRLDLPGRELYGFALPLLTTELLFLSINAGSVVVLGWVDGTEEVARYRAVFPAARLNQVALFTFTTLFIPLAARHFARGDDAAMRHSYRTTALWLAVLGLPVFLLTVPLAAITTETLFGGRYDDAAVVMAVLSVGYYVSTVLGFNAHTLQAYGRLGALVTANAVAFVVNIPLTIVLGARFGATGVAAANATALVIHNAVNQWNLRRLLGPTLGGSGTRRVLVAIAVSAGVCAAIGFGNVPVVVAVGVVCLVSLATVRVSRHHLAVLEMFPELARVPGARRLLT